MLPHSTGLPTSSAATSGALVIDQVNNCTANLHQASESIVDMCHRELATRCKGEPQADAKLILDEDGFVPLTSV